MTFQNIQNGESGSSVRAKLNDGMAERAITADSFTSLQAVDTSGFAAGKLAEVRGSGFRWSASAGEWQPTGPVSVKAFGATGDGSTDDSSAISAANTYAATHGVSVHFPPGTYRGRNFLPTTSWRADAPGQAVIQNNLRSEEKYEFVECFNESGLTFENLTFDGWVTDDPGTWDSENFDSFQGAIPFYAENCTDMRFIGCTFQNAHTSGFRGTGVVDSLFIDCRTERTRGEYGDGYYFRSSVNNRFIACAVRDFTRIGFVNEGNEITGLALNNVYIGCYAENGHDMGLDYGGTEYNSGYWFENAADVSCNNCTAVDTGDRGFTVGQAFELPPNQARIQCTFIGCQSYGANIGFAVDGKVEVPVFVRHLSCYAQAGSKPFYASVEGSTAGCSYNQCSGDSTNVGDAQAAAFFLNSQAGTEADAPSYYVTDCDSTLADTAGAEDGGINTADISGFDAGARKIYVTRFSAGDRAVILKARQSAPHTIVVTDTRIRMVGQLRGKAHTFIRGSIEFDGEVTLKATDLLVLNDCTVVADTDAQVNMLGAVAAEVRINGGVFSGCFLEHLLADTISDRNIRLTISGTRFERDNNDHDYSIRVEYAGAVKPTCLFEGVQFFNTSGTANASVAPIHLIGAGIGHYASAVWVDDTLTYSVKDDGTLGNFASGETLIPLH